MNRNLRSFCIVLGLLVVALVALPTLGSTRGLVNAADQVETATQPPASPEAVVTEQPTDAPVSDEVPSDAITDVPTDTPVTEEPTDTSPAETTGEPEMETTAEVTEQPAETDLTATPEATLEVEVTPELTATLSPEETLEPEVTLEAEITPEVTDLPFTPTVDVRLACTETGIRYDLTNTGADMESASSFTLILDEAANAGAVTLPADLTSSPFPVEFMLISGESTTIAGGFGQPTLILDGIAYQAESPCLPPAPPVLEISAVCAFETGVNFTVTNSGGAMPAEQPYTITNSSGDALNSLFQLETGESLSIEAGYGQPTFSTGDLVSSLDVICEAPTAITGIVWNDADGDAVRGAAESGIVGVSVSVIDAGGTARTAVTAGDGSYRFDNLHVGTYSVVVDTTTLSTDYALSYPDASSVVLEASGVSTNADFGFKANPTAAITGTVWLETVNYGVRDADEMGINGVIVELVDQTGTVVAVAPVDALTGTYVFTALLSGSYTVRLNQATLFTPNGVTWNSDDVIDYETVITLTTGQTLSNIDFGLVGTY